ncbi:N-carbamoylputrescine amidase [Nitrospirillum viridazoti]|uniref:N-carbamoylputrescine amidase n=1 Tax=Nitrospirillum viridazoti CBAmc TaxID=1441467 RepID=A0A248JMZ5_9PROT|nr:N-carbamoylputrescine amidase [Nitrospirillum amazonense]ASG20085.1 N-carbamoylputrescine amidase [Nitrospirillum amazonense CBAmc]TWB36215.1 N-carbamoylputrescine amidase [Nitrospirillum amazonense]
MRQVTVAATQTWCDWNKEGNVDRVEALVRRAAAQGAQIILPQELFETPYFCINQKAAHFAHAAPAEGHPVLARFSALARELQVVLPTSFFERAGNAYFNSLAMIDADGGILGIYRKSHIPDGPGYQEKFYFSPGDTGFQVYKTRYATIGTAICWDQWFPEAARVMALQGAEILFYPTAIGSEPQDPTLDSRDHWQRVMQGHAGANLVPLVASNRVGTEPDDDRSITFYGSSFIAGPKGEKVAEANREEETVLTATFDLDEIAKVRSSWGVFRDRRPELYAPLLTLDGRTRRG